MPGNKVINGHKVCPQCLLNKPVSDYWKNNSEKLTSGIMSWCRQCCKDKRPQDPVYFREYYQKNKESRRSKDRERRYGMSQKQFDEMLDKQGKCCAICKTKEIKESYWCVDHDHAFGDAKPKFIRGILCTNCNRMLGGAKDNADTLRRAAQYIDIQYVA